MATDAAWMDRHERAREEAPDLALSLIGIAPGQAIERLPRQHVLVHTVTRAASGLSFS
jgi:hypothetical protein